MSMHRFNHMTISEAKALRMDPHTVVKALRTLDITDDIGYVRQMPSRKPIEPREVWIGSLSVWVRADGSAISGDLGRGYFYPTWLSALFIRNAIKWREKQCLRL